MKRSIVCKRYKEVSEVITSSKIIRSYLNGGRGDPGRDILEKPLSPEGLPYHRQGNYRPNQYTERNQSP